MLLHNDFFNKKLYLTHKTRRKSPESLKALTVFKAFQHRKYLKLCKTLSLTIFNNKYINYNAYKSKSFKLSLRKTLSNKHNNHLNLQQQQQQQQQQQSHGDTQNFSHTQLSIQTEKRLSFPKQEFNHRSINDLKNHLTYSELLSLSFKYSKAQSLLNITTKQSTKNDLKQRLALRKRYLRRKRKRKYFHKRLQQYYFHSNNYYQQQLNSHRLNCSYNHHYYHQHKYEKIDLNSLCHQQINAQQFNNYQYQQQQQQQQQQLQLKQQQQQPLFTKFATLSTFKRYSHHQQQQRLSNSIIMLQLFIVSILRLSLHSLTDLYQSTLKIFTTSARYLVTAVINATTLPIIQLQQQFNNNNNNASYKIQQQQQQQQQQQHYNCSFMLQNLQHCTTTTTQTANEQQLPQTLQHQPTSAVSSRLHYQQQPLCEQQQQQRCRREQLLLTTKGLNKYSWIFLLIYLNLSAKVCLAGYNEKRLLHDLLDTYNTLERPVLNESDPLQLSFGLTLMQIIDVDEKNQLLVTNVWLKLEWNDMNLRWNTSDYGGIKDLRIPPHRIWKPDVLMYNSADEGFDGTYQTNVVVRNNGSCLYVPPGIFKSTCKIDITWFPFDDQRCEMKFGSWTYDGFQVWQKYYNRLSITM